MPPHLRKSQGSGGDDRRGSSSYGRSSFNDRGGPSDDRRGSSFSRGGGDGGGSGFDSRRGSDFSTTSAGPPPTNSRWSGVADSIDRRGSSSTYSRRGSSYGPRVNERGFHGDMKPDKRLEARLFDNSEKQTTGINFDNYDKIPIEVSGDNIPDPVETYEIDTVGEELFRNTQLCGYTRPTPVQKYSVPIGAAGRDLMVRCGALVL